MPIYEYYSPDSNKIYQFYAKTLALGGTIPKCPDNPGYRMVKILSTFSVVGKKTGPRASAGTDSTAMGTGAGPDDPRMEAAMNAMEGEFANVDENDPRAMGRMMRRMAELTGEKMDGDMEEVVRKLEEGADPESLGDPFGPEGDDDPVDGGPDALPAPTGSEAPAKPRLRRIPPVRDPKLYDYEP